MQVKRTWMSWHLHCRKPDLKIWTWSNVCVLFLTQRKKFKQCFCYVYTMLSVERFNSKKTFKKTTYISSLQWYCNVLYPISADLSWSKRSGGSVVERSPREREVVVYSLLRVQHKGIGLGPLSFQTSFKNEMESI